MSIDHLSAELQAQRLREHLEQHGVHAKPARFQGDGPQFCGFIQSEVPGLVLMPEKWRTNEMNDPPYAWVTLGNPEYGTRYTLPEFLE